MGRRRPTEPGKRRPLGSNTKGGRHMKRPPKCFDNYIKSQIHVKLSFVHIIKMSFVHYVFLYITIAICNFILYAAILFFVSLK